MLPERLPGREGGWHFFISRRLANMDGKPGAFTNNFLRMFEPAFGDVDSWATLQIRITAQPSVILLDDLGEVESSSMQLLVPKLFDLATQARDAVRIVVTLPGEIGTLLENRQVNNPKYAGPWRKVLVPPFLESEMEALLALLPERARAIAAIHRATIKVHAAVGQSTQRGLAPQKLQLLCSRLFEADREGRTEAELSAIIESQESYQ